ncbi:MAG TPA: glycosyltransferase family 4 protein, partial [Verrucomicrobiae bacterium]|nr:glycosyltransferase family 4 protein [Verrucomicrobiae bacterium]
KNALDKKGGNLLSPGLFWAMLRADNVRLFHAHAMARVGGMVRTVARLRKKPFILSLHGGVFDVPASEVVAMQSPVEGKLNWAKPLGALLGVRRLKKDADFVICVGHSEFEQAKKHMTHDRVAYLPNGVNPEKFARGDGMLFRRKHGIPENAVVIATISRIDAQKNQLALVEAFARLNAQKPESFLLLIGPETQPEYANRLRTRVREQKLDGVVKILPGLRTDNPDLVNAYHACDIFALPSVHEPFGIVVLEAWCAGKPVVTSNIGGLKALVEPGRTGLMFDPNANDAVDKLTECLRELTVDESRRRTIGEAGRAEATANYTWTAVATKLEEIYQQAERHVRSK